MPMTTHLLEAMSHPTRVRGLKRIRLASRGGLGVVAPHAGAWIETVSLPEAC